MSLCRRLPRPFWVGALLLVACGTTEDGEGDPGNGNGQPMCPVTLPEASVSCTTPECSAATGDRLIGESNLEASQSSTWLIVLSAASEFVLSDITVDLGLTIPGALVREWTAERRVGEWFEAQTPKLQRRLEALRRRVAAEAALTRWNRAQPRAPSRVLGSTAVQPVRRPGQIKQGTDCSQAQPACGIDAVCIIPLGQTEGTCETEVTFGIRNDIANPDGGFEIETRVRQVGGGVAILTDSQDTVSDDDVAEIASRFTNHIAPLDHAFFGEPVDASGNDFDGNGVVMVVLTEAVALVSPDLVGFFDSTDLLDPSTLAPTDPRTEFANGADVLFMRPPGSEVSLDSLSGTIGHEYQHLISFFTKDVELGTTGGEEVWLDEGLSTFAEDMLGYGEDAFANVALYLDAAPVTSLVNGDDTSERRGLAALLVRYFFEQQGGGAFGGAGTVTDGGGVSSVRSIVQSVDTGTSHFDVGATGRSFGEWVSDLLVTVALDGTDIDDVSCNPRFQLQTPEVSSFTGFQRGLDLRSSIPGTDLTLSGPSVDPYAADQDLPFTGNGGEIRTLTLAGPSATISLSTDAVNADSFDIRIRAIPAD